MNMQLNLFEIPGEAGKPFLKLAGGKSQLTHEVIENLPTDIDEISTYVEPFIGGGEILFHLLNNYPNLERMIISDANIDLLNLYKVLQCFPAELLSELCLLQHDFITPPQAEVRQQFYQDMHNEYKERIILPGVLSIRHAALFLFLNKTGAHNGYRGYLKDKFKAAMNKNKELLICDIDTLTTDSRLLENVEFMPGNFTEALGEIDEKTFFFFNPPYSPIDKPLHLGNELMEESDLKWQDIFSYCDYLHANGAKFLLVLPYYPSELKIDEFVAHWNNQYQVVKVDEWLWLNTRQNKQDETQNILIKNY